MNFKYFGILDDPSVFWGTEDENITLSFDSKEKLYQFKFYSHDPEFAQVADKLGHIILNKTAKEIFISQLTPYHFKSDRLLAMIRKALFDYWGLIKAENIFSIEHRQDILCRCKNITWSDLDEFYIKYASDVDAIYQQTELAGICGTCLGESQKYLTNLELNDHQIFGADKIIWKNKIEELLNEYYLVCPPDFSNLSFEFISIIPKTIKLKCYRGESGPSRKLIQDSINSFFKGQLDKDIPISIVI